MIRGATIRRDSSPRGRIVTDPSPNALDQYKYDVAFSFLSQDEPLAVRLNDLLKGRLSTFLYSEAGAQARLAGRDGEEVFHQVFGIEARTVVVLYRSGWGEQGFTLAESTAIRNRAFEERFDFLTFIPLDTPATVPKWLPKNRIWLGLERHGIEHAATVVESRVQEAGGTPHEETVEHLAERTAEALRVRREREAFLNSQQGVDAAMKAFDALYSEIQQACSTSSGLLSNPQRLDYYVIGFTAGKRRVRFSYQVPYVGTLKDAELVLEDWSIGEHPRHPSFQSL